MVRRLFVIITWSGNVSVLSDTERVMRPVIIPLRDNSKNLLDRINQFRKVKLDTIEDRRPDSELSLDELAARELLRGVFVRISHNICIIL